MCSGWWLNQKLTTGQLVVKSDTENWSSVTSVFSHKQCITPLPKAQGPSKKTNTILIKLRIESLVQSLTLEMNTISVLCVLVHLFMYYLCGVGVHSTVHKCRPEDKFPELVFSP